MGVIGSFGDIIFEVSDEKSLSFTGFTRETSSSYENHGLIGQKPRTEYVAPGLDTVSFTVLLNGLFGVKPREEMNRWVECCRSGIADILIIGDSPLGVDRWVVTSVSQSWDTIWNKGELVTGKADVSLQEYVSTMWTVDKYRKNAGIVGSGANIYGKNSKTAVNLLNTGNGYGAGGNGSTYNTNADKNTLAEESKPSYNNDDGFLDFLKDGIDADLYEFGSNSSVSLVTNINFFAAASIALRNPDGSEMCKPRFAQYIAEKIQQLNREDFKCEYNESVKFQIGYGGKLYQRYMVNPWSQMMGCNVFEAEDAFKALGRARELEKALSHEPGDQFNEERLAAGAFLLQYNWEAVAAGKVLAAMIRPVTGPGYTLKYTFSEPEEITEITGMPKFVAASTAIVYTDLEPLTGEVGSEPQPDTNLKVCYVGPSLTLKWRQKASVTEPEWIGQPLRLDGASLQEKALAARVLTVNGNIADQSYTVEEVKALEWNQIKVDKVWQACTDFYHRTTELLKGNPANGLQARGIQVDPRLMLAIAFAEGSGSFNTSSENKAADGQHGVHFNFDADLENAVDIVGGKAAVYAYFQEAFSIAREKAWGEKKVGIGDYDDFLHYLNWVTPRLSFISNSFSSGNYAGNNNWHRTVRSIYSEELSYSDIPANYTLYIRSLGSNLANELAAAIGTAITPVSFFADRNGEDAGGVRNGEYTIIGAIVV
jgi:hypothetical protein